MHLSLLQHCSTFLCPVYKETSMHLVAQSFPQTPLPCLSVSSWQNECPHSLSVEGILTKDYFQCFFATKL